MPDYVTVGGKRRPVGLCAVCGHAAPLQTKTTCVRCYMKQYTLANRTKLLIKAKARRVKLECSRCHKIKAIANKQKQICFACHRDLQQIVCSICGTTGPRACENICMKCYLKSNYQNNKATRYAMHRAYKAKHIVVGKAYMSKYHRDRRAKDPEFRIIHRLRARLRALINGRGKKPRLQAILGCSNEFFMKHIASLFSPGMSFSHCTEWHLDHIIPCSAFDLTDPEQQRMCFHYSNIRPAWAFDNLSKGDTVPAWFNLEDYREAFKPFTRMEAA